MNFDGEYRQIGEVDITALRAAVASLPEAAWHEEVGRQQAYKAHSHTHTIPLIFDPDMRHDAPTVRAAFARFQLLLEPVMTKIVTHYADHLPQGVTPGQAGYFVRIILVRLAGDASIGSHRDHGASLSRAHRIHLPVVSNEEAIFGIAGVIRHLAPGEVWEINNRKPHAVRNASPDARIHFIFDYVLPGEIVSDPEGELVA